MRTLVAQAVAELHLGRTEEALAALDQAAKKEPEYADAIANRFVLAVVTGKDSEEFKRYATSLRRAAVPTTRLLTDGSPWIAL